ncbi:MAG TPA: GNAT family N-acetyltransferase [Gaiellaceae bacterium]|nr:GNAT family N-acetyltransferase [Gaiellaceae bacterium]
MTPVDWPLVAAIYAEGIATGNATFDAEPPSWAEWDASHLPDPRLASELGGEVVGWAALAPTSRRACYRGVAEVSVYVAAQARGRGVGSALLRSLVRQAEQAGIWTIQASIFPENVASVELHRRCGFRVVGLRERIARLDGAWRDTVLMERRAA